MVKSGDELRLFMADVRIRRIFQKCCILENGELSWSRTGRYPLLGGTFIQKREDARAMNVCLHASKVLARTLLRRHLL